MYKRQVIAYVLEIPIFLQPLKKTLLFMDRNLSSVAVKFCVMVWAVSYTHLDVYKRQVLVKSRHVLEMLTLLSKL